MISKILKIKILIMAFFLSSCSLFVTPLPKSWNWGFKPRPLTGTRGFPPATTPYGKGFKDGCTTAWDVVSTGLLSDLDAKFDYKRMQKSSDYQKGWWDGYEECSYIMDWDVI